MVIAGPSLAEAQAQITQAEAYTNLVEWRLDLFETQDITPLRTLKQHSRADTIFTLRPISQGGKWEKGEEARLAKIEELASLIPAYIDLEHNVPQNFVDHLKQKYPDIKIILSRHNFEQTPSDLSSMLNDLQAKKADYHKIACMANSSLDTYKMLALAKLASPNCMLMTMGPSGYISRILASVVGRPITYVSLSEAQAVVPGQISANELLEVYGFAGLNPSTAIYGLIGDPVDQSVSHISHNEVMRHFMLSSVYVKTQVAPHELGQYLALAKQIGIKGLSVTIPHKEAVMQYCDSVTPEAKLIGAVNTLEFCDGKIIGSNTDAQGALDALEAHIKVKGKKIVVLGAGGAARAIAWQAIHRGADVTVCNRSRARAQKLAADIGCKAASLDDIVGSGYSVIINATSVQNPIDPKYMIRGTHAMDIRTLPKDTLFLQQARLCGCELVFGYEMFIKQAVLQFTTWFKGIDPKKVEQVLTESVIKNI